MVQHPFTVRWVVGLVPQGGPIELFLFPVYAFTTGVTPFCLWDGAYKRTLAVNPKE